MIPPLLRREVPSLLNEIPKLTLSPLKLARFIPRRYPIRDLLGIARRHVCVSQADSTKSSSTQCCGVCRLSKSARKKKHRSRREERGEEGYSRLLKGGEGMWCTRRGNQPAAQLLCEAFKFMTTPLASTGIVEALHPIMIPNMRGYQRVSCGVVSNL